MTDLINPQIIQHQGSISEDDLRHRLLTEAYEQAGWLTDEGKPMPGVIGKILRGNGRQGGCCVIITRDLTKSGQPRLVGPEVATK